ncbi:MAG TPA: cupin domain-containing protein, partial [Gaiellaceae bacterium]|nr:cupin domain-containing protein [Gaiellaceae bacterium]
MQRANLNSLEVEYDDQDPEGYRAGMARFGPSIGAVKLGASLYELPPGQSICPYHYEYPEEEWLIVLEGRPTLRHPEGEDELEQGDVVCFPEGPEGAHKVTNRTDRAVKVLMFSTKTKTAVAVYPDSDKIGIWTGNDADHVIVPRASNVDYY